MWWKMVSKETILSVTDPGFSRPGGGGANSQGGGANLLFGKIFPRKLLHENERN